MSNEMHKKKYIWDETVTMTFIFSLVTTHSFRSVNSHHPLLADEN